MQTYTDNELEQMLIDALGLREEADQQKRHVCNDCGKHLADQEVEVWEGDLAFCYHCGNALKYA